MLLSDAIQGAVLYWQTEGLSDRTIEGYQYKLEIFSSYIGDVDIASIDATTIQDYFSYLRAYRKANGHPLAKRTILQHWTSLKSFFRFISDNLDHDNVMDAIPPPKAPTTSNVEPFTESEVNRILAACKPKKGNLASLRNRAIIMTLLDVGIRNSELRNLRIEDYRAEDGRLHIKKGKGNKDRFVYVGKKTAFAIWQYLAERNEENDRAWLFCYSTGTKLDRQELNKGITKRIGRRAGVPNCHPHRFRHTCAVLRIIYGESAEMLMHVLGHSSIQQALYYVRLAKMDTRVIQRRVSPMDNI